MSWEYLGSYYNSWALRGVYMSWEHLGSYYNIAGHFEVCTCHGTILDDITMAWVLRGVFGAYYNSWALTGMYKSWEYIGSYYNSWAFRGGYMSWV